jgi:hypothetical protein
MNAPNRIDTWILEDDQKPLVHHPPLFPLEVV